MQWKQPEYEARSDDRLSADGSKSGRAASGRHREFGTVNSSHPPDRGRCWSSAEIGFVSITSDSGRWRR
jgi:hypothetical protein